MIHWANATHACTCEVDVETGQVTLTRYIVSEDVGPMINPNVVEGQIAGGTVQGIGGALLENLAYDDDGNPLSVDVRRLPAARPPPRCRRSSTATSRSPGPASAATRAAARAAPSGRTPAVINAVNDALAPLGVTVTRLPASPAAIVELIEQADATKGPLKVELNNEFRVAVPTAKAWEVLTDVKRVAPCIPGATAAVRRRRRFHRRGQGQGRPDHGVLPGRGLVPGEGRGRTARGHQGQRQGDPR